MEYKDLDELFEWVIDYTLKYSNYSLDENDEKVIIKLPLPGVFKEDINVRFIDTNLEIKAKR